MSKAIIVRLSALLLFVLVGVSCQDTSPCESAGEELIVETIPFFDKNTPYARVQNVNENESVANVVITNQQDYEKYVAIKADAVRPAIDFSQYVLLAGRVKATSSDEIVSQTVFNNCNDFLFEVRYGGGALQVITVVNYFAVVPNSYSTVGFDIKLR